MIDPKTLTSSELQKINKNAQAANIAICAIEYFASILVSGVFLASLLTRIGVPDAVAGIVASLTSFGAFAQIAALFFTSRIRSPKRIVAITQIGSMLLFITLYLVPFFQVSQGIKTTLFIVLYLSAIFSKSLVAPIYTSWAMSYVDKRSWGDFTATNEIVSLIGGMMFSWVMGLLIDHYNSIGKPGVGFILSGVTLFVLCLLIILCFIPIKELKPTEVEKEKISFVVTLKTIIKDQIFRKITYMKLIWSVAVGIAAPFYGTYLYNELNISLATVSIIAAVACTVRVLASRPIGRMADRTSRVKTLYLCLGASALAAIAMTFATPVNGMVMYIIFSVLEAIHAAGATNGVSYMVFEFVAPPMRTDAFAIQGALSGGISLFSALIGAKVVSVMQASGNTLFGITVYPQQVLSFVACLVMVILIVYVKTVIEKLEHVEE